MAPYTLTVYQEESMGQLIFRGLSLGEALDLIEEHDDGETLFDLQVENLGN